MITPSDIKNPKRKSGFNHVQSHGGGTPIAKRRWRGIAYRGSADRSGRSWFEYTIDESDTDPEYQAALGVMRDRRAQRAGKQGYVYLITEELPGGALLYAKIGYSVNPKKRVAELQTGNARKLVLLYAMPGTEEDERRLHTKYVKANVLQEWFRITPELICEFPVETKVSPAGD